MDRVGAILSLGTRKDATTWEKGCAALGIKARLPIKKPLPTLDEVKDFFVTPAHWVYFGGHFGGLSLFNDNGTATIDFQDGGVHVTIQSAEATPNKADRTFRLHEEIEVVLWGGCSVCGPRDTVRTLRTLFGNHVLLGFVGSTGWAIVDAMLGGGFMKTGHFFDRLSADKMDATAVRNAWMGAALQGYGGGDLETRFRAVDPDGQEWQIVDKKIQAGRKL